MSIKQLLKAIIFLNLAIFLFVCVSYMFRPDTEDKQRFAGFYAEPKDSLDMIYIGASSVHPYYAAPLAWHEFGFASYPLAMSWQPTKAILSLIKEARKYQNPKLWIIDCRNFLPDEDTQLKEKMPKEIHPEATIRLSVDYLRYSATRIDMILRLRGWSDDVHYYFFDLGKYHQRWKSGLTDKQFRQLFFKDPDPIKGFLFVPRYEYLPKPQYSTNIESQQIPENQQRNLEEILQYCNKEQLKVLFVFSPSYSNDMNQSNYKYISEVVEESGYCALNFDEHYNDMDIDFSIDFYNVAHTNIFGAEKYTRYLGSYIKENYNLPDRREDASYYAWNIAYDQWLIKAEDTKSQIQELINDAKAQ